MHKIKNLNLFLLYLGTKYSESLSRVPYKLLDEMYSSEILQ